jgi:voltage-gated potassium channel
MENVEENKEKLNFLNLLIIILSFYVLGSLVVDTFFTLPPEIAKVLNYVDNFICGVFLLDFIIRFRQAENKL